MIGFERPKQDDSRREEIGVISIVELGECRPRISVQHWDQNVLRVFDFFKVVATPHNRDWPGSGSNVTFAVEGWGWKDQFYGPIFLWGFFKEQECYDFLTGKGKKQYPIWDQYGNPGMCEPRERLGIPDTYVVRYKDGAQA